ncbi:MAG TPA: SURF1 family protein [Anaerolineaceae bacterium]|nr:SURF1 family protein [Anaerolineaceae bacterium]
MMKAFVSGRRLWLTLGVLLAVAVMIRLGFWQLDRLAQRRAANAQMREQLSAPALDLNADIPFDQLTEMEYRSVTVTGTFDFTQQVALKNQVNGDRIGFDLLTPLKISGSDRSVLVERGWIPYEDAQPSQWQKYAESGTVTVKGIIHLSQSQPGFGGVTDPTLAPGQSRLETWAYVNLDRIRLQMNFDLLPIYIQQAPDPSWTGLPARSTFTPDLSEGPHLSYAIQWFIFSAVLSIGYPILVWRRLKKTN